MEAAAGTYAGSGGDLFVREREREAHGPPSSYEAMGHYAPAYQPPPQACFVQFAFQFASRRRCERDYATVT
jgi:hypothetical protein